MKGSLIVPGLIAAGVAVLCLAGCDDGGGGGGGGTPSVSIADVSLAEGTGGTTEFVFTVTLSAAPSAEVTVDWATSDGTATAAEDFTPATGTLTFAAGGGTTQTVTVSVAGDSVRELDETFTVELSNAAGATVDVAQAVGTIQNDDLYQVSVSDVLHAEGDVGVTAYDFAVTVTPAVLAGEAVTVDWAASDGTAAAGLDYTAVVATTLTFAEGESQNVASVSVTCDAVREFDESFTVGLTNPSANADIVGATGVGTIQNDDLYAFGIADISVAEAEQTATVEVTLTSPVLAGEAVTVECSTSDGTATAGADYDSLAPATLVFTEGEMVETVSVTVHADSDVEPHETVSIDLSNASTNAAVPLPSGTLTILNDDAAAGLTLSIDDVTLSEGTGTTTDFVFTVTLAGGLPADGIPVSADWVVTPGTADAGTDFTDVSGTVAFTSAGPATQTITVPVVADDVREIDEDFTVDLSGAANAGLLDSQGAGSIQNDDLYKVTIDDLALAEGDAATTPFLVTVSVSPAVFAGELVTVGWETSDGTAAAGADYAAVVAGLLTFSTGEASKLAGVSVTGETDVEYDEVFHVDLPSASANAAIADAQGDCTIISDDLYGVSVNDVTLAEGDAGTTDFVFTLTVSPAIETGDWATVTWRTSDDTALAGSDYTEVAAIPATFTEGETSKTLTVTVSGDTDVEFMDRFLVELSDASGNAMIVDGEGEGAISNDDGAILAYVDLTGDDTDGLSWPTAFHSVGYAADRVSESGGGEIWVAAATCTNGVGGSTEPVVDLGPGNMKLYGGFEGFAGGAGAQEADVADRDWDANETVLHGMGTAENVVYGLNPAAFEVDGFTITGGNAAGDGGGVSVTWTAPVGCRLANCRIVGNSAAGSGGGLFLQNIVGLAVVDCEFSSNDATNGGAMAFSALIANSEVTGCTISGNTAEYGGGVHLGATGAVDLSGCEVSANSATKGGAVYVQHDPSMPVMMNMSSCLVSGNCAPTAGGIFVDRERCSLTRCIFEGNDAGAVYADGSYGSTGVLEVVSCGFIANVGGALYCCSDFETCRVEGSAFFGNTGTAVRLNGVNNGFLDSCTFGRNWISFDSEPIDTRVWSTNCVFWGDESFSVQPYWGEVHYQFFYCNIEGCGGSGASWETQFDNDVGGNIDADPLFVDIDDPFGPDGVWGTADDGLRLRPGSPCIDAGNSTQVPGDRRDLDGDLDKTEPLPLDLAELPRFAEDSGTTNTGTGTPPIVDMGAYEFQGTTPLPELSISDVSLAEGNSSDTAFVFMVTITVEPAAGFDATVDWATDDGTATLADSDYTPAGATLTFRNGEPLTQPVTVQVTGDAAVELDETFTVDLSNPVNASVSDAQGVGTIPNDD